MTEKFNLETILKKFGKVTLNNKWQVYEYCKKELQKYLLNEPQEDYDIHIQKIVRRLKI